MRTHTFQQHKQMNVEFMKDFLAHQTRYHTWIIQAFQVQQVQPPKEITANYTKQSSISNFLQLPSNNLKRPGSTYIS